MLTHPNPDQMCTFIAHRELRDLFIQLMWVLRNLQTCSAQKQLEMADLDRLDQQSARLYQLWLWLDKHIHKNVTPKVHMLCAHLPIFARARGWFAAVSEQAIEHLHAQFNRMAIHFHFIALSYFLKEPRFSNTPEKSEGAALHFAQHQFLANCLHDRGMDPSASSLKEIEEESEIELEIEPSTSTSRTLDFENC